MMLSFNRCNLVKAEHKAEHKAEQNALQYHVSSEPPAGPRQSDRRLCTLSVPSNLNTMGECPLINGYQKFINEYLNLENSAGAVMS